MQLVTLGDRKSERNTQEPASAAKVAALDYREPEFEYALGSQTKGPTRTLTTGVDHDLAVDEVFRRSFA
jgi:hypothetical protein